MKFYVLNRDVSVRDHAYVVIGTPSGTPSEWILDLEVERIEPFTSNDVNCWAFGICHILWKIHVLEKRVCRRSSSLR